MFEGRANRMTYFIGQLLSVGPLIIIVTIFTVYKLIVGFIPINIHTQPEIDYNSKYAFNTINDQNIYISIINLVFFFLLIMSLFWVLTTLVPLYGLAMRRFHDIGQSGWWALLTLVPYLNFIIGLLLLFVPGESTANKYGPQTNKGIPIPIYKVLFG